MTTQRPADWTQFDHFLADAETTRTDDRTPDWHTMAISFAANIEKHLDADTATRIFDAVRNDCQLPGEGRHQTPVTDAGTNPDNGISDYNGRFTAAILALIIDKHAPDLHDRDTQDVTLDPWHLTLDDLQHIVRRFDLPEEELLELVRY